ncbi:hypothetical protein GCM10026915_25750 [Simiduia litorea]
MHNEDYILNWPADDDGDVFRSLEKKGFDFDKEHFIDINLDFDHWPLTSLELSSVLALFPESEVINPEKGQSLGNGPDMGFIQFQVKSKLDYKYITELQASITNKLARYGGWCSSWGVGTW